MPKYQPAPSGLFGAAQSGHSEQNRKCTIQSKCVVFLTFLAVLPWECLLPLLGVRPAFAAYPLSLSPTVSDRGFNKHVSTTQKCQRQHQESIESMCPASKNRSGFALIFHVTRAISRDHPLSGGKQEALPPWSALHMSKPTKVEPRQAQGPAWGSFEWTVGEKAEQSPSISLPSEKRPVLLEKLKEQPVSAPLTLLCLCPLFFPKVPPPPHFLPPP